MTLSIATTEDIPQLVELLAMLFAQEVEFSPDAKRQTAGLKLILENPSTGTILVLREGPKIIGMVSLLYTVSTYLGSRVALMEDMVIHPSSRGRGVGKILLSGAIDFAKKQGCQRLTLLTDADNEASIVFYQRQGFFVSTMVPMRLLIPPQGD